MKRSSVSILLAAILIFGSARPAAAAADDIDYSTAAVAADAVVVRPLCFTVTILGAGLFIVTLPIAAISRSVHKSAHALISIPARQTFIRKLGDLSGMDE